MRNDDRNVKKRGERSKRGKKTSLASRNFTSNFATSYRSGGVVLMISCKHVAMEFAMGWGEELVCRGGGKMRERE